MKRGTAISLLLVIMGWLMLPVAGARLDACSMQCCRRKAAHSQTQCHGENAAEDERPQPTISAVSETCPSGCVPQIRNGSTVLFSSSYLSIYVAPDIRRDAPSASKGAEPKLRPYGGRAPPPFA